MTKDLDQLIKFDMKSIILSLLHNEQINTNTHPTKTFTEKPVIKVKKNELMSKFNVSKSFDYTPSNMRTKNSRQRDNILSDLLSKGLLGAGSRVPRNRLILETIMAKKIQEKTK